MNEIDELRSQIANVAEQVRDVDRRITCGLGQVADLQSDLNRAVAVVERMAYAFEHTIMLELQAIRLRQDELADVNLTLVEALWDTRGQNDRLEREVRRLRCLADNDRIRAERLNRDTPVEGIPAVTRSEPGSDLDTGEHHVAYESSAPESPREPQ